MHVALPTVPFVAGWLFWSLLRTKAVEMCLRIKTTQEDPLFGESVAPSGHVWRVSVAGPRRGDPVLKQGRRVALFFLISKSKPGAVVVSLIWLLSCAG